MAAFPPGMERNAMTDEIPQWALEEACRRLNEAGNRTLFYLTDGVGNSTVCLVASLIAQHEQPPVDPVLLAAREIYEGWAASGGVGAPKAFEAAIRRGMEMEREKHDGRD